MNQHLANHLEAKRHEGDWTAWLDDHVKTCADCKGRNPCKKRTEAEQEIKGSSAAAQNEAGEFLGN